MSSNRKIDALVTEHVMGFAIDCFVLDDEPAPDEARFPHYSTDISAAWEVLEKLRAEGISPQLTGHDSGWSCFFDAEHGEETLVSATLAICLAALKVRGVALPASAT